MSVDLTPEKVKQPSVEFVDPASPSFRSPAQKRPNLVTSPASKTEDGEIFALKFYSSMSEVAQILCKLSGSACSASVGIRSTIPMKMPKKEECSFIVSLDSEVIRRDCSVDAYGKWVSSRSHAEFVSCENGHMYEARQQKTCFEARLFCRLQNHMRDHVARGCGYSAPEKTLQVERS
ncbi:MAG: hypothetical protein GY820_00060 [Gammaproteobacteria bacterium]|nr:hypothetical protein [Gammaproteobacteria bacterium]